jgi:hypothetical protein
VDGNVIGFLALDEVLRLVPRGMMDVTFEAYVGNNFLHDDAAHSPCLRVPLHVVAVFECLLLPSEALRAFHLASSPPNLAEHGLLPGLHGLAHERSGGLFHQLHSDALGIHNVR